MWTAPSQSLLDDVRIAAPLLDGTWYEQRVGLVVFVVTGAGESLGDHIRLQDASKLYTLYFIVYTSK